MDFLVNIDVDDLDRAVAFYTAAFGLRATRRLAGGSIVEMLGAAAPIYLLEKKAGTSPSTFTADRRRYERHWTPLHLDVVVDEIEPAVARAIAAGGREEAPVAQQPWGKIALMADPFGNGFCIVQFTGRGYDEIAD